MIGYASSTGTGRNLRALQAAGWRLLFTPFSREIPTRAYALDNGAWSAFCQGRPFDDANFLRLVDRYGAGADWIVVPDIVEGGLESLRFSESWIRRLRGISPLLIAVQDGMFPGDLESIIGGDVGIFIGGSTQWKEQSAAGWGELARRAGCYLHMGRVNTQRRIKIAAAAGCHSFDGTSVSRYAVNLPRLDSARKQAPLWF